MKKLWQRLENWFENKITPAPLTEVVNNGIEEAQKEIMHCDYAILKQQFLKHMAVARRNALIEWGVQNDPK